MSKILKISLVTTLFFFVFFRYCTYETLENAGLGAGNNHRMRYPINTKYQYKFFNTYIDTLIKDKNLGIPDNWKNIKKTVLYDNSAEDKIVYFKEKSEFYHFSIWADGIVLLSVYKDGNWITDRKELKEEELKRINFDLNNMLFIGLDSIGKSRNISDNLIYRK
jgi:hemerythrin superfamily protein